MYAVKERILFLVLDENHTNRHTVLKDLFVIFLTFFTWIFDIFFAWIFDIFFD